MLIQGKRKATYTRKENGKVDIDTLKFIPANQHSKVKGKKEADRMGKMAVMFMIIGLIIWGMNLVINF
jgi:hypothetical protein